MFVENNEENKIKYIKTKDYNYLDGLYFLCMFSTFYEDTPFDFDEETKEILAEMINLTKIEYENSSLKHIANDDFEACFELMQSETEDYESKIDEMSKEELKTLQKQSYVLAKKIARKIAEPIEIETNETSQRITELSFAIAFAGSKKEQDALFKEQDALFKQEDIEKERIQKIVTNSINTNAVLTVCFENCQYTYHAPVKSASQKIRNYFDKSVPTQTTEKERDL